MTFPFGAGWHAPRLDAKLTQDGNGDFILERQSPPYTQPVTFRYRINAGAWVEVEDVVLPYTIAGDLGDSCEVEGIGDTIVVGDVPIDTAPDAFSFPGVVNQPLSTLITSQAITPVGYTAPAPVTVANGEYRIDAGPWTTVAGVIEPGSTIQVRTTTPATNSTNKTVTLTIGGVAGTWVVRTEAAAPSDDDPDPFTFTTAVGAPLGSTVNSNTLTPVGYDVAAVISVFNGEYSVNSAAFTSADGTISPGQTLQVRTTTPNTNNTEKVVSVFIGTTEGTWSVTTVPAFGFTSTNNAPVNTLVESETITPEGFTGTFAITITNGEYRLDGGAWTSAAGNITNGQTLQVRTTTPATNDTSKTVNVFIGSVLGTWTVTTAAAVTIDNTTGESTLLATNIGGFVALAETSDVQFEDVDTRLTALGY